MGPHQRRPTPALRHLHQGSARPTIPSKRPHRLHVQHHRTMVSDPPPKPSRNHRTETAETTNETAAKPHAKPIPKPRNHLLRRRADGFASRARLRTPPSRLRSGFATLGLRCARRYQHGHKPASSSTSTAKPVHHRLHHVAPQSRSAGRKHDAANADSIRPGRANQHASTPAVQGAGEDGTGVCLARAASDPSRKPRRRATAAPGSRETHRAHHDGSEIDRAHGRTRLPECAAAYQWAYRLRPERHDANESPQISAIRTADPQSEGQRPGLVRASGCYSGNCLDLSRLS